MKVVPSSAFLTAVLCMTAGCGHCLEEGSQTLTEAEMDIAKHLAEMGEVYTYRNMSQDLEVIEDFHETSPIKCDESTRFYSMEGWCNNLQNPHWGVAFKPFIRDLPSAYSDGKLVPRVFRENTRDLLPSARSVCTKCLLSVQNESRAELSDRCNQLLMEFGQFQSHDTGATPAMESKDCCIGLDQDGFHRDIFRRGPCFPIPVPQDDRYFNSCIPFTRSLFTLDSKGVAQQINAATSFVDASNVYGSSQNASNMLRAGTHGHLRVTTGNTLPLSTDQKCLQTHPMNGCPVAGDNRVNVFPGLTAMHLLWHREHNRLADSLRGRHSDWEDERLFQEARRILIAQMQQVVYGEYLPIILGHRVMKFFRLNQPARYNPHLNPTTINSFTTAAYRFGHSQVNNAFMLQNGQLSVPLKTMYFRPYMVYSQGEQTFADILVCLLSGASQKSDEKFAQGVSDFLFFEVDRPGASSDLLARNIQRGRDHGLQPYYQYMLEGMDAFGVPRYRRKLRFGSCIHKVYKSLRDVDLYVGGMAEKPLGKGEVGPTFAYMIGKQFQNFREGDRFFFDIEGSAAGFTNAQIKSIKQTSMAGIICRNSQVERIQRRAFLLPEIKRNPEIDCKDIADLDFSLW